MGKFCHFALKIIYKWPNYCFFSIDTLLLLPLLYGSNLMDEQLILRNNLKEVRTEKKLSQTDLAKLVGVSRNTISSIETGQFNPTAKLALILCIALDKKFEELFYFD